MTERPAASETDHVVALWRLQSRYADAISSRNWPVLHELFRPDAPIHLDLDRPCASSTWGRRRPLDCRDGAPSGHPAHLERRHRQGRATTGIRDGFRTNQQVFCLDQRWVWFAHSEACRALESSLRWTVDEIVALLAPIDEDQGIDRGTFGQHVYHLLVMDLRTPSRPAERRSNRRDEGVTVQPRERSCLPSTGQAKRATPRTAATGGRADARRDVGR